MNGIFLHSCWRSSGTWLWEKLRTQPQHLGFYEPLHEFLPSMTSPQIDSLHSAGWRSRHPRMSRPYFAEYAPLLKENGILRQRKGVAGAQTQFSFDQFFMNARQPHERLYSYINRLCDTAYAAGRLPVMKFARSQGRLGWFARHFPQHTHALLIRQPWSKFRSAWRCLVEDGNPYFMAAPFMVLERNAHEPAVAALIRAFDLPVGEGCFGPRGVNAWMRKARRLEPRTLYRAMLALWLLNTANALPAAALVLNADDPPEALASAFGLALAPEPPRPAATLHARPLLLLSEIRASHDTARAAIAPHIDPALRAQLESWLAAAEAEAANDLAPGRAIPTLARAPTLLCRVAKRLTRLNI
jgi:hypothetical protein